MVVISVSWLNLSWGAVKYETKIGLMQHSHIEIKNKLLRALDAEYNVVDMPTVFEVVTILEQIPITQEILEKTRLGKLINEFRRKTSNEVLAKRAKDLVRRWRNMMTAAAAANTGGATSSPLQHQNGATATACSNSRVSLDHQGTSTPMLLNNNHSNRKSPSLTRDIKVESVPRTHAANKRLRKELSPCENEPLYKIPRLNGTISSSTKHSILSAEIRVKKQDRTTLVNHLADSSLVTAFNNSTVNTTVPTITIDSCSTSVVVDQLSTNTSSLDNIATASSNINNYHTENDPEINSVLSKKRSRKKQKHRHVGDEIKEKLVAMTKTVKIKTTKELLDDLKSKTDPTVSSSVTEPPSLSKNAPLGFSRMGEQEKRKNKSSHLEKPVRTSQTETERARPLTVDEEIESILAKLPPIDYESIDWNETPPTSPIRVTVTDTRTDGSTVEKEVVESIDGTIDHATGNFKEWQEVLSRRSFNDDLIPVLPYTIID